MFISFQVKVKPVDGFDPIWQSEGTGSRAEVSIWSMQISNRILYKRNKQRVVLGQYAAPVVGKKGLAFLKAPPSLKGFTIELTDLRVTFNICSTQYNFRLVQYQRVGI